MTAAVPLLLAVVMVAIKHVTDIAHPDPVHPEQRPGANTWMERRGDKKQADDQAAEYTASLEMRIDRVNQINHDFLTWARPAPTPRCRNAAMCTDLSTRLWERSADHRRRSLAPSNRHG